jgi:hypothetical protein
MFHKFARGRASIYETFGLGPVNTYFAPATPLPFGLRTKNAGRENSFFRAWIIRGIRSLASRHPSFQWLSLHFPYHVLSITYIVFHISLLRGQS